MLAEGLQHIDFFLEQTGEELKRNWIADWKFQMLDNASWMAGVMHVRHQIGFTVVVGANFLNELVPPPQ